MKFINGARNWRPILGTQTFSWPLTPPHPQAADPPLHLPGGRDPPSAKVRSAAVSIGCIGLASEARDPRSQLAQPVDRQCACVCVCGLGL